MSVSRAGLIAAAGLCVIISSAEAADIYHGGVGMKDEQAPMISWTGFYVGVHAGKSWGDLTVTDVDGFAGSSGAPGRQTFLEPNGLLAGATLGYNWQRGMLVFGVETDIGHINNSETKRLEGTIRNTLVGIGSGLYGDVTARVGLAVDNALFYAKGGVAFFDGESQFSTDSAYYVSHSTTDTFVGWTAGGGVEYSLARGLSVKAEYQYFDFGNEGFAMSSSFAGKPVANFDEALTMHTVKAGLNVHLGNDAEPLK